MARRTRRFGVGQTMGTDGSALARAYGPTEWLSAVARQLGMPGRHSLGIAKRGLLPAIKAPVRKTQASVGRDAATNREGLLDDGGMSSFASHSFFPSERNTFV